MNSTVEIASLNLEDLTSEDNGLHLLDSTPDSEIEERKHIETRRVEKQPIGDQARVETVRHEESKPSLKDSPPNKENEEKESEGQRHLPEEKRSGSFAVSAVEFPRSAMRSDPLQVGAQKFSSSGKFYPEVKRENDTLNSTRNAIEELKRQNYHLMEVLSKIQKSHATEKKRFNDILLGIDKALSSLPIRLEKIRVRNQRNLSIITSSRLHSGDGNQTDESSGESSSPSDNSLSTSQESQGQISSRMKSLLRKIDDLNELIHHIHDGDFSPIEVLVNSELYAISLLKKEIKTTKKQIEEGRTDTETVTSCEGVQKELGEDSCSKAKNSFSNELNKASNFKIFENHMILQEEALNLLTRKIKETEEALLKEVEAKEAFRRENEALAKEIFRLKTAGEEAKGEKSLKTEKLKPEAEATGNRPYRLIKELKSKLEEKEKSLIAWKSKYTRLEATNANKSQLLESEKKKNFELETVVKNLKTQNKAMSTHLSSVEYLNGQLKEQMDILKHQVEILANGKIEQENKSTSKLENKINELENIVKTHEEKVKEMKEEAQKKLEQIKTKCKMEMEVVCGQLKKYQEKNEEFSQTFKELISTLVSYSMGKEAKSVRNPSYNRIREILHITPSDLELLFSVCIKSSIEKEVERLNAEFELIIEGEDTTFAQRLASWFFDIIMEKIMQYDSDEKNGVQEKSSCPDALW